MKYRSSVSRKAFLGLDYIIIIAAAIMCLFPLVHILAISLSSSAAATAGLVKLWPVDFTLKSYEYIMNKPEFFDSFLISIKRVLLGVPVNMIFTVLIAYPLSKNIQEFKARNVYAWILLVTMIFNAGLIPWYVVVNKTGLIDKIWALIIPSAVPVFNVILLMNFFKELPKEIDESARMDGAGHFRILVQMYLPISLPALATVTLFATVHHWNSWFDGLILMNSSKNYPLQSYLRTIVISTDTMEMSSKNMATLALVSDRTSKAAQLFLAMIPILCVYPFLQRYFMKGLVLGSVKG